MIDAEEVNGILVPEGVMMLAPRDFFDPALIGTSLEDGVVVAVYSRSETIKLLYEENVEAGDDDPWVSAVEHFDFNVSGSLGKGFPVFVDDDEGFPLFDDDGE